MRYLGLALFAEGPTDHRFLRPLLRRLTEHLCLHQAVQPVDIGEVLELHSPPEIRDEDRAERICRAAMQAAPAWEVLFVHTDGGGDPVQAARARIAPAVARLRESLDDRSEAVEVVPVRETEAWLLADAEALTASWGVATGEAEMRRRRPRAVERVADPKAELQQIFRAAGGRKRASQYYEVCGESASLQRLGEVPSFQRLSADLAAALRALRVLPT